MSLSSAAAGAINGRWDVFDQVASIVDDLIARINALDAEDTESLYDYSMAGGELEVNGGPEELLEALAQARAALDEICTLCQRAEAALPE